MKLIVRRGVSGTKGKDLNFFWMVYLDKFPWGENLISFYNKKEAVDYALEIADKIKCKVVIE